MYKEIEAGSWDKLVDQGVGHIVPISSRGLTSSDRIAFFSKTAASEKFLHEMKDAKLADGEVPIHVNAIGASAWYASNRKGDAFSEQTLRTWHSTFTKEGNFFAHHMNRDPKKNYGKIASSCYNDRMHRVELLIIANTTQESAEKNAGLVLPSEFLDRIEKDADIAVSMGCFIKHDICGQCGNIARTRAEYCDETNCCDPKTGEWGFGCKHGLAKVLSSGRVQHVDNIEPHFFDISAVGVPADRTAFGYVADYIPHNRKTASIGFSPEKYLDVKPVAVPPTYAAVMGLRLKKLAFLETTLANATDEDALLMYGLYGLPSDVSLGQKVAEMTPNNRYSVLHRLSSHGVLLSPEAFTEAMGLEKSAAVEIRHGSRVIYRDTFSRYEKTAFAFPASVLFRFITAPQMKSAEWCFPAASIAPYKLDKIKTASSVQKGMFAYANQFANQTESFHRNLAEAYALYKAAALCCFPKELQEFGEKAAILQTMSISGFGN